LFLDDTQPESLVVAAINHPALLGAALFRRFDSVIAYALPDSAQALDVLRRRLGGVNTSTVSWDEVYEHVTGLSQAELVRAAEAAAKRAILGGTTSVSTAALVTSLDERRSAHNCDGPAVGQFVPVAVQDVGVVATELAVHDLVNDGRS
jgi:AAA+ superfamily predicted ATPase